MKRLIVLAFAVILLASCNKQREVYIECEVISNTDVTYFQSMGLVLCEMGEQCLTNMVMPAPPPISVGTSCESEAYLVEKGQNFTCNISLQCCSDSSAATLICNNPFEIAQSVYVNGNLEDTRIITEADYVSGYYINYIVY